MNWECRETGSYNMNEAQLISWGAASHVTFKRIGPGLWILTNFNYSLLRWSSAIRTNLINPYPTLLSISKCLFLWWLPTIPLRCFVVSFQSTKPFKVFKDRKKELKLIPWCRSKGKCDTCIFVANQLTYKPLVRCKPRTSQQQNILTPGIQCTCK